MAEIFYSFRTNIIHDHAHFKLLLESYKNERGKFDDRKQKRLHRLVLYCFGVSLFFCLIHQCAVDYLLMQVIDILHRS